MPRLTNKQMRKEFGVFRGASLNDGVPGWIRTLVENGDLPNVRLKPIKYKWQAPTIGVIQYSKRSKEAEAYRRGKKKKRNFTKPKRSTKTQKAGQSRFNGDINRQRKHKRN